MGKKKSMVISFRPGIIMWLRSSHSFRPDFKLSETPTKHPVPISSLFHILMEWEPSYPGQYSLPICCFSGFFLGAPGATVLPGTKSPLSDFLWKRFSFLKPESFASWKQISPGGVPRGPPSGFPGCPLASASVLPPLAPAHPPQPEALGKGSLPWNHSQGKIKQMTILSYTNWLLPSNITVKTNTSCKHIQRTHPD